uniref:Uncharacterized protein n=1 Tax=Anguilla anguilla TaxID=7936 RepID=A0A0E9UHD8_ANGAN
MRTLRFTGPLLCKRGEKIMHGERLTKIIIPSGPSLPSPKLIILCRCSGRLPWVLRIQEPGAKSSLPSGHVGNIVLPGSLRSFLWKGGSSFPEVFYEVSG